MFKFDGQLKKNSMQKLPGIVSFRNYESCENLFDFQINIFLFSYCKLFIQFKYRKKNNKKTLEKILFYFSPKMLLIFIFDILLKKILDVYIIHLNRRKN